VSFFLCELTENRISSLNWIGGTRDGGRRGGGGGESGGKTRGGADDATPLSADVTPLMSL
jgi:hypothetical protein